METGNDLLRMLSDTQIDRLGLEPVTLHRADYVYRMDEEVTYLYFMERCYISLIRPLSDDKRVPAWSYDGTLICGQIRFWVPDGLYDLYVQIGGDGWRVTRERLLGMMMTDQSFGLRILRWIHYFDHAVAMSAACRVVHSVEQRLCRALLAIQLAMKGDERIPLSLPAIAATMPAGRSHVYRVAMALERMGAIGIGYAEIELRDPAALAIRACPCLKAISDRRQLALQNH